MKKNDNQGENTYRIRSEQTEPPTRDIEKEIRNPEEPREYIK